MSQNQILHGRKTSLSSVFFNHFFVLVLESVFMTLLLCITASIETDNDMFVLVSDVKSLSNKTFLLI